MPARLTTEEFIRLARARHGDKYDYSKVIYHTSLTAVEIICSKHQTFMQSPTVHLRGGGCQRCGDEKCGNVRRLSNEVFIRRARSVHGNKYGYSRVAYVHKGSDVIIICRRHGEFPQSPNNHSRGQGCPQCSVEKRGREARERAAEAFASKAEAIHGNGTYDYSSVRYETAKKPVSIICREHGPFSQTPASHLSGCGCKDCGELSRSAKRRLTKEQFIKKAENSLGKGI